MLNRLRDVFKSFQRHEVKYVVIGGVAAILHGVPRATFDLDILIEATPDNTRRLLDAMLEAGLGSASLTTVEDLLNNEITIFKDILTVVSPIEDTPAFRAGIKSGDRINEALLVRRA